VAAGAIAEKFLHADYGVQIVAWVSSVGTISGGDIDENLITRATVDQTPVRCPNPQKAEQMMQAIMAAKEDKDSLGGIISCVCRHVPAGLGEPVFDKMEARLAQAMLSIPATKGFEIGSGFGGTRLSGSQHNDPFVKKEGRLGTITNNSGGVQGGISNGEPIVLRVAFKPPATIGKAQKTADFKGRNTTLEAKGRHDPCVVPRAVPIVETMAALVIGDLALQQRTR
jgi:chorismate synthase